MIKDAAVMIGVIGAALAVVLLMGCDHTHMSPHFGVANRAAYRAQVIDPNAGSVVQKDPPLDPEESAIVAKTYMRSLAPPGSQEEPPKSTVLVMPPTPPGVATPQGNVP